MSEKPPKRSASELFRLIDARQALAALAGLSFGASPLFSFGFYDLSVWGPVALVWLAVLFALVVARPSLPRGPALAAVAGLALLWLWSLLSTSWAESVDQAWVGAGRWLLYATVLVALLMLLRGSRAERTLLGAAVAPILGFAAYLVIRMAVGHGGGLFLTNRLNDPLEYVNATAAYLLLGFWPLVAVIERARSRLASAAALAGAVVLAGLTMMTQSRGALAALLLSALIVVALIPGRARRAWVLAAVLAGLALSSKWLGDVVATLPPGAVAPDQGTIRDAALSLFGAGVVIGGVWMAVDRGIAALPERLRGERGRLIAGALIAALAFAGLAAAAVPPDKRADEIAHQYRAFKGLQAVDPNGSRLASGGGHRYDYWRIAIDELRDHPMLGVGAGNYPRTYFAERRTAEDIQQPHSIELQALSETGLIGGAALCLFVAGALIGLWKRARGRDASARDPGLAVAAGGAFCFWLLQTSVDWLHLIPGLTGIALCAAAALLAPSMRDSPRPPAAARRNISIGAVALVLVAASASVALPVLAAHLTANGVRDLNSDPNAALDEARQSLALNAEALPTYYLESAALARQGLYLPARAALLEATRRAPSDFVTWGLLGDLALRAGKIGAAQDYYREASALNPLEARLQQLATDRALLEQTAAEAAR